MKNLPPIGTTVYHFKYGEGDLKEYKGDFATVMFVASNQQSVIASRITVALNDISLTPYTVEGFTPLSDYNKPKIGDWGYFWDNEISFVSYSKVGSLDPLKDVTGVIWCNFSKDIPEHIKKLQNDKP